MIEDYNLYLDNLNDIATYHNIPINGTFEITSKCNLKCFFCYIEKNNLELNTDEWIRIINEAVASGLINATFTGGEIFTREDFEEIYNYTYDLGVKINLFTNGLLIKQKDISFLTKRPPNLISLSLYGASDETYKRITKDELGFTKIKHVISEIIKNNLALSLKTIAVSALKNDFVKMVEFSREKDLKLMFIDYVFQSRNNLINNSNIRLTPAEVCEIDNFINNEEVKYILSDKPISLSECSSGKTRFAVLSDGRLVGCLKYYGDHVDLKQKHFKDAIAELRCMLSKHNMICAHCQKCMWIKGCDKCPAINFIETGSLMKCSDYRKALAQNYVETTGK